MVNIFILVISRYDYNAGYQIKIKLISRLTKDKKQAEISISTKGVSSSDRMQTIEKKLFKWLYSGKANILHLRLCMKAKL